MKTRPIKSLCLFFIICFSPAPVYGSFKEIWKGNFENRIEKLLTIDLNKNGIKEIVVREYKVFEYKILKIYEWDKNIFVAKWQTPKYKNGIDFQYYTFEDFLLVEIYDSKSTKSNKITPYTLNHYCPVKIEHPEGGPPLSFSVCRASG